MKKLLLTTSLILLFFISYANMALPSVFWGWSYGEPSGVMSEGGTGNCYQEVQAQHYIMWIGGETQQKYRYVDCSTGDPMGGWSDSLMGIE